MKVLIADDSNLVCKCLVDMLCEIEGILCFHEDGRMERGDSCSGQCGHHFSSGVHFYQLTTGDFSQTRRMVLMK